MQQNPEKVKSFLLLHSSLTTAPQQKTAQLAIVKLKKFSYAPTK